MATSTTFYIYNILLLQGVATAYDSDGEPDVEPQDNTSVEHMVSPLSTPRSGTHTSARGKEVVKTPTIQSQKEVKKAANKRKGQDEDLLAVACDTLKRSKDQDRHDTFGKNVANSLRLMTIEQQIFAEKIISDVLFEGRLGNLNRMTLGRQNAPSQPFPNTSTSYSTHHQTMPYGSAYYAQPGSSTSMESYSSYDN
ncbi:protein stand still [Plakobranchus ocellatus]|uniref:Protein stand still n=1 Tax=Plakobranchus ocellatus TaxID=259542 RepID=A0AAV3Y043_9GAST|nr:protein stand still [Plakobranchus ocellatus]